MCHTLRVKGRVGSRRVGPHLEQQPAERPLHGARAPPGVSVERCVNHARVGHVGSDRVAARGEEALQPQGEEHEGELALRVRRVRGVGGATGRGRVTSQPRPPAVIPKDDVTC